MSELTKKQADLMHAALVEVPKLEEALSREKRITAAYRSMLRAVGFGDGMLDSIERNAADG